MSWTLPRRSGSEQGESQRLRAAAHNFAAHQLLVSPLRLVRHLSRTPASARRLDLRALLGGLSSAPCAARAPWLRLLVALWLALAAAAATSSAHWATVQSLPSLTPLRDDLLARLGRGADRDLDLMHGVCTGGAAAVWAASALVLPSVERAALQWLLAYGGCLLLRAACVRATLLPDPAGGGPGARPLAKHPLMAAMTHPAATKHDMLPSGHMLLVGVTAALAPLARAQPAAAALWVAAAAFCTMLSRTHYTADVIVGLAIGLLSGQVAATAAFLDMPCAAHAA